MDPPPLIFEAPVSVKRDAGAGGVGDDCNVLAAVVERVSFSQICGLQAPSVSVTFLVANAGSEPPMGCGVEGDLCTGVSPEEDACPEMKDSERGQ